MKYFKASSIRLRITAVERYLKFYFRSYGKPERKRPGGGRGGREANVLEKHYKGRTRPEKWELPPEDLLKVKTKVLRRQDGMCVWWRFLPAVPPSPTPPPALINKSTIKASALSWGLSSKRQIKCGSTKGFSILLFKCMQIMESEGGCTQGSTFGLWREHAAGKEEFATELANRSDVERRRNEWTEGQSRKALKRRNEPPHSSSCFTWR